MDTVSLLLGLVLGSIGVGYSIYGKKQRNLVALLCGLLLIALPYFIDNNLLLMFVAVIVMLVPKFLKI